MEKFPVTDVIIANDISKHFSEETSLNVLKGLWNKTGKLLIVHVPTDSVPIKLYGHLTEFNGKKLRKLTKSLKNGVLLSDWYKDNNALLTDLGYLIMEKTVEMASLIFNLV